MISRNNFISQVTLVNDLALGPSRSVNSDDRDSRRNPKHYFQRLGAKSLVQVTYLLYPI